MTAPARPLPDLLILDCDGVKIELWQQKGPAPALPTWTIRLV